VHFALIFLHFVCTYRAKQGKKRKKGKFRDAFYEITASRPTFTSHTQPQRFLMVLLFLVSPINSIQCKLKKNSPLFCVQLHAAPGKNTAKIYFPDTVPALPQSFHSASLQVQPPTSWLNILKQIFYFFKKSQSSQVWWNVHVTPSMTPAWATQRDPFSTKQNYSPLISPFYYTCTLYFWNLPIQVIYLLSLFQDSKGNVINTYYQSLFKLEPLINKHSEKFSTLVLFTSGSTFHMRQQSKWPMHFILFPII
jgi:hypothetical protein